MHNIDVGGELKKSLSGFNRKDHDTHVMFQCSRGYDHSVVLSFE